MLRLICFCLVLSVVKATRNLLHQEAPTKPIVPAVIVFGDSIMDTGNNNHIMTFVKCNYTPYGRNFDGGVATGRFSDGKVPSDFIAEKFGVAKTLPPYVKNPNLKPEDLLKGVTFASGASGFDPLTSQILNVLSLQDQLKYFKEYMSKIKKFAGETKAKDILENSAVFLVCSSNDLATTFVPREFKYNSTTYTTFLADLATKFVKDLYQVGLRKIGIFSAVPVGCVPTQRQYMFGLKTKGCDEVINQRAMEFNSKLSHSLDSLQKQTPDGKIIYINVYDSFLDIVQNYKNYGFKVVDRGCCDTGGLPISVLCNPMSPFKCSNSSDHVFWDSYHPTEKTYRILVDTLLDKYISRFY